MKDGDCAGFAAFNGHSGVLTVKKQGKEYILTMTEQVVNLSDRHKVVESVDVTEKESISFKQKNIWLRIDGEFRPQTDKAQLFYSFDGQDWKKIGSDYQMRFDYRRLFMGTRYAIFNYAKKKTGGYVDVDEFCYQREHNI